MRSERNCKWSKDAFWSWFYSLPECCSPTSHWVIIHIICFADSILQKESRKKQNLSELHYKFDSKMTANCSWGRRRKIASQRADPNQGAWECGGGAWRGGGKADDPVIPLFLLVPLHSDREVQGVGGGAEQEQLGEHAAAAGSWDGLRWVWAVVFEML